MQVLDRGNFLELAVSSNRYPYHFAARWLRAHIDPCALRASFARRGTVAMMPAVIWQTQLTWDPNAQQPWSDKGGAPKASFYNLAGDLQCEVVLPQIFLTWGDVVYAANWQGERLGLIPDGYYVRPLLLGCHKADLNEDAFLLDVDNHERPPKKRLRHKSSVTEAWFWHNLAQFAS